MRAAVTADSGKFVAGRAFACTAARAARHGGRGGEGGAIARCRQYLVDETSVRLARAGVSVCVCVCVKQLQRQQLGRTSVCGPQSRIEERIVCRRWYRSAGGEVAASSSGRRPGRHRSIARVPGSQLTGRSSAELGRARLTSELCLPAVHEGTGEPLLAVSWRCDTGGR